MATYDYTKPAKDCLVSNDGEKIPVNHANRAPRMPDNYDPEKEYKKADYRDHLTLDENESNDNEMAKYAVKNAKRYFFTTPVKAQAFMGKCIQMTLIRCGLIIEPGMPADLVQGRMEANKIQIENRNGLYHGDDIWKSGLYIFKEGELVAFVSLPMQEQPSQFAIDRTPKIFVITNAVIDRKGYH